MLMGVFFLLDVLLVVVFLFISFFLWQILTSHRSHESHHIHIYSFYGILMVGVLLVLLILALILSSFF